MVSPPRRHVDPSFGPLAAEMTTELLYRVKSGDSAALERLLERCLPALSRWAHGRLPAYARDMLETQDLVQETVIAALRNLEAFESRHQGALQAYLRQSVKNRVQDIIRQHQRRPLEVDLSEHLVDQQLSPLDAAIGSENTERYEAALERLQPADREAIIGRLELGYSYEELAIVLNKPTSAAARMAVNRGIKRLIAEMQRAAR